MLEFRGTAVAARKPSGPYFNKHPEPVAGHKLGSRVVSFVMSWLQVFCCSKAAKTSDPKTVVRIL